MALSYTELWNDALRLVRANRPILIAVAGTFIFLPSLLLGHFLAFEQQPGQTLQRLAAAVWDHWRAHWPWFLAGTLLEMLGSLTIYLLLLGREGRTVASAIAAAFLLLPTLFAASALANLAIIAGLIALIVPGLYLIGRLSLLAPVVAAEERRNPVDALNRTFALSAGHGWAILGICFLVYVVGLVLGFAASRVIGSIFILLAGREIGVLVGLIVSCAVAAAVAVVILALLAAIYSRLSSAASAPRPA